MGLQYLAEYVGDVHSDGIVSEKFRGYVIHSANYFGDFFIIPKVVVAVIVALFWNYNMQRFFVYRNIDIRSLFKRN